MSSPAPTPTTTTTPAPSTAAATTTVKKTKKPTPIKAVAGFSKMTDADLSIYAGAVVKGMTGNTHFPSPPVDLTAFGTSVTALTNAIQAALDGGANAKAVKGRERKIVVQDMKVLVIYVQNNCNDDLSIFTSSGFTAQAPVKTTGLPVAAPAIRNLDYGTVSGQLTATVKKVAGGHAYFIRYGTVVNGVVASWTTISATTVNKKLVISGLTPGVTYGFQVQALGTVGYSDWSTLETIMCV
jgi:hypothetical protein